MHAVMYPFQKTRLLNMECRLLTSSSVMAWSSPLKSLSSVRKSMQWHSCNRTNQTWITRIVNTMSVWFCRGVTKHKDASTKLNLITCLLRHLCFVCQSDVCNLSHHGLAWPCNSQAESLSITHSKLYNKVMATKCSLLKLRHDQTAGCAILTSQLYHHML